MRLPFMIKRSFRLYVKVMRGLVRLAIGLEDRFPFGGYVYVVGMLIPYVILVGSVQAVAQAFSKPDYEDRRGHSDICHHNDICPCRLDRRGYLIRETLLHYGNLQNFRHPRPRCVCICQAVLPD